MADFQNMEIPFLPDGNKQVLTAKQLADDPRLLEFINRFPNFFRLDPVRYVYIFEKSDG